ncbi:MAG: glutamate decarboxylase, partial [Solirubrobacteraceae bacterium]|nr:glutamate decarboxylase [Solirubrobacteraceae bacterium]
QPVDPRVAYQLVHDELLLDGNARLNLATFVTTWMEPEAKRLITECLDKNLVDKDEYPQSAELERRCVDILADLWHAPVSEQATGTSTSGSSEACMLGGIALLRRWRSRLSDKDAGARPNLVMGSNVQVCWEKFCRYWDVEPRLVPVGQGTTHLTGDRAAAHCDQNTIGVVAILGSTFDGSYEPVAEIAKKLDNLQRDVGVDVPIHVDAASGGFIAPFLDPDLEWDFRIERVQSINASGHKYGLVFPGVGWAIWRDAGALPEDLIFNVDYLGGNMPTYGLNFSRPAAQVIAQYFTLVRLGREGFRRVQQDCRDVATWLAGEVGAIEELTLLSLGDQLPVFAFRLADGHSGWTVYDVSERLRGRGWIVPAYAMPDGMDDVHVLRVVVRNGFGRDLAGLFLEDLRSAVQSLNKAGDRGTDIEHRTGFHH